VEHASRSSSLIHVETSQDMGSQYDLKTGGGAVRMVHMASSQRSRGAQAKDGRIDRMGYIRLLYPNFTV
jgi:hypothetical protein